MKNKRIIFHRPTSANLLYKNNYKYGAFQSQNSEKKSDRTRLFDRHLHTFSLTVIHRTQADKVTTPLSLQRVAAAAVATLMTRRHQISPLLAFAVGVLSFVDLSRQQEQEQEKKKKTSQEDGYKRDIATASRDTGMPGSRVRHPYVRFRFQENGATALRPFLEPC